MRLTLRGRRSQFAERTDFKWRSASRERKSGIVQGLKQQIRSIFVVGLGILLLAAAPEVASAGASIYSYMDDEGVVHFSDAPRDDRYQRVRKQPVQEGIAISPRTLRRGPGHRDYDRLIAQLAGRHGVPAALVKAVIAAESNFEPEAVSRVGAQGLMQLMPATARELGVDRPFGIAENIDGGVRYLRAMLDRYGDMTRALAAYNAGPAAVDRYRGVPPYRETQAYVKRVLGYYRGYRTEFERASEAPDKAGQTLVQVDR
jgi:soluble lytic murein transglycosylase-like protein